MGTSTRLIRRRIKSVTSTKKITKAMELVAASKMRKAVNSVLASRPYAETAWAAIADIAKVVSAELHPLLKPKDTASKVLILLFTSDRGLCGGFNTQILRTVKKFIDELPTGTKVEFVTVGRKGQVAVRRMGFNIVASFTDLATHPTSVDVRPVSDIVCGEFVSGAYKAVYLAFADYVSALVQKPKVSQLLPIARIEGLGEVDGQDEEWKLVRRDRSRMKEYQFEPSSRAVLDMMLPRLVEVQAYQAVLETAASEHSARMVAMRGATDAATEMIDSLTLSYNRARQAGITAEIAEISSGKAALEGNR